MLETTVEIHSPDTGGARTRHLSASGTHPQVLPDLLLIERARSGDERAIEALIRRYNRRLFRVAHSVLQHEERSEEAVREACLTAFGDLSRYESTGKFAAWLTRLAFVQARALRLALRGSNHSAAQAQPAGAVSAANSAADGDELKERRELEHAIGQLPEVFRTVFVLRAVEGVSGIETAASLAVHETTVRTRLYRAQRRLGAETARRARAAPALLAPTPECTARLVAAVLGARPHGSMLTISASTP